MKKPVIFVLLIALTSVAFAQIKGGLKAGLNMATLKVDVEGFGSDSENGTSFHFGAYANFGLSDAISVQPELLYNSLKVSDSGDDFTMNYLSIPVMFQYSIAEKFNIQAGPQIGLLMSTDPSDAKDGMKGTDLSLNVGAGANFGKLNATLRYCLGLANTADVDGIEFKNNVFQISLGYQLFGN